MLPVLFTIGHSNHTIAKFVALLRTNGVTAVADVRSSPRSSYHPQFNREALAGSLKDAGIVYAYLGEELGARRTEPECYSGQRVDFSRVARSPLFERGLKRVAEGLKTWTIAMMCAEKEPLECHRSALICRYGEHRLGRPGHIRDDGTVESMEELEARLLTLAGLPGSDLYRSREDRLEEAWQWVENRVAWRRP